MSDIFISYASVDRDRARELATQLERLGWSVWWDRQIQAGKTFAGVIESEIDCCRCVIVLWSRASVDSRWVRDEANEGLKREALVPVFIEPVDPPLGFRSIHAANLAGWRGDPESPGFRDLVRDLSSTLNSPPAGNLPPSDRGERSRPRPNDGGGKRPPWLILGAAAILVIAIGVAGVAYFRADHDVQVTDRAEEARRKAEADAARQGTELDAKRKELEAQRAELDAARRAQAEADARRRAEAEAAARDAEAKVAAREAEAQRRAEAEAARQLKAERDRLGAAEDARRKAEAARRAAAEEAARKADAERARLAAAKDAQRLEEERKAQAAAARAKEAERASRAAAKALAVKNPEMLPSVGDSWSYRYVDGFRRAELARLTYRIEDITGDGLTESLAVSSRPDFASRVVVNRAPTFPLRSGLNFSPPDLAPYLQAFYGLDGGPRLPTVTRQVTSDASVDMRMRVVGTDAVTVPAGRFDTIKVEAEGRAYSLFKQLQVHSIITIWYAPKVKRFVKYTAQSFERELPVELNTFELVEYRVNP
ncbi:MAG: toll/interleukin-1 receptor domain-containing protein [Betaproteobacteria bacterium]|jgi:hypothetical protein|nr:toll/interleukin-1 receptor domain-containing protein [Betaproteobacteria bacterium]